MNKDVVARQIPLAYKVLEESNIVRKEDEYKLVPKGYRGQISSFGAAVTMGSLVPAIAFFSKKSGDQNSNANEDVDRTKLMQAVFLLLKADADIYGTPEKKNRFVNVTDLMEYVCKVERREETPEQKRKTLKKCTEEIENAAIALKLAIGMYLDSVPKKSGEGGDRN